MADCSNLRGCDGERTYFNGASFVTLNGDVLSKTKQFALEEVEIAVAAVDLEDVRAFRNSRRSRQLSSASAEAYPRHAVLELLLGHGRDKPIS